MAVFAFEGSANQFLERFELDFFGFAARQNNLGNGLPEMFNLLLVSKVDFSFSK